MNKCKKCNKETSNPKFCGHSCSASYSNPRKKPTYYRDCRNCDSPIVGSTKKNNVYCDTDCANDHVRAQTLEKVLAGECAQRKTIRKYLTQERGHQCQVCGIAEWNGQPAPIEIDHIDGDWTNDDPVNIRLICPNCHAQTDTYKGKNVGHGRHARRERYAAGKSY
jgi:hypothetical protein